LIDQKDIIVKDYSNRDLQKVSFVNEDLRYSNFSNSDLRGADFSGANCNGVDFTGVKTGIPQKKVVIIFFVALGISLISGYIAMLGGIAVQHLVESQHKQERSAGTLSVLITIAFIVYAWRNGGGVAIRTVALPIIIFSILVSAIIYLSGAGTGKGMLYLGISLILVVVMLITGTIARTVAGSLSKVIFWIVALSGEIFGKSVGGGIGTILLAIICAMISKRAMKGNKGFELLNKMALYITGRFGTSFRNSKMANTRFSQSKIKNVDFSHTDVSLINWGNSKKINCIIGNEIITDK
jgi:hypothetical protein